MQIISTLVNVSFQIRGVTEQEKTWLHPWKTIEEMMHTRSSVRGCSLLQQPPFKNFEPTGNPYTPALIAWKPVESDLHTQSSSSNMHTRQPHCACHVTKIWWWATSWSTTKVHCVPSAMTSLLACTTVCKGDNGDNIPSFVLARHVTILEFPDFTPQFSKLYRGFTDFKHNCCPLDNGLFVRLCETTF